MLDKQSLKKFLILTSLSLLFLAMNSILCRMALLDDLIDPYSFTFYRIISGAFILYLLISAKEKKHSISYSGNWLSAFMLFLYAISFSYSFVNLDAGLGSLLLFGVVQLSMLFIAIIKGEKLNIQKIIGIVFAFVGLVYLLAPSGDNQLSYLHVLLMIIAGLSWGVYTILGKKSLNATLNTYDNFFKASIFAVVFYLFFLPDVAVSIYGIFLALVSGTITSAIGYTIWYTVLPQMKIVTASIIQLLVPIIAIVLSIVFLDESLTFHISISVILVSFGVYLSIKQNSKKG